MFPVLIFIQMLSLAQVISAWACRATNQTTPRSYYNTAKEMEQDGWSRYLSTVYGRGAPALIALPFNPYALSLFYWDLINQSCVNIPPPRKCSSKMAEYHIYPTRAWFEPSSYVHVHHHRRDPLPSDAWVEVTHCLMGGEGNTTWTYHSPGSGAYINTGRSIAFARHEDAAAFFNIERFGLFHSMPRDARSRSYDTVQFLLWPDQECGNMAIEILILGEPGINVCGPPMRGGWNAALGCKCVRRNQCAFCLPAATKPLPS